MSRLDWDEDDEPVVLAAPAPPQGSYALLKCKAINFNTDSAVPPPVAIDVIAQALLYAKEHPSEHLLLLSHTDRVASASYNQALSEDRAANVYNLLRARAEAFQVQCDERTRPIDCDQLLAWADTNMAGGDEPDWGCASDRIAPPSDRSLREDTKRAIVRFLRRYARFYQGQALEPASASEQQRGAAAIGTRPPAEFWAAIFELYQRRIRAFCRLSEPSHRSLVAAMKLAHREPSRGCGERYPLERPDEDEFESETNRRTELMFFASPDSVPWDDLSRLYDPERFAVEPIPCPEVPSNEVELQAPSGSLVLLLDISGSMNTKHGASTRFNLLKQAVERLLDAKRGSPDQFAIVAFSDRVAVYDGGALQPCTGEAIDKALRWVKGIVANGSTNTSGGFEKAASLAEHGWTIVFVSDGLPSAGITNETSLKSKVAGLVKAKDLKVDAYGFVGDADAKLGALMKALASVPPSRYWHPISTR